MAHEQVRQDGGKGKVHDDLMSIHCDLFDLGLAYRFMGRAIEAEAMGSNGECGDILYGLQSIFANLNGQFKALVDQLELVASRACTSQVKADEPIAAIMADIDELTAREKSFQAGGAA